MTTIPFEQTTVVYYGGGRRWFTKRAALSAIVRAALKRRCKCEPPEFDVGFPGAACRLHDGGEYSQDVIARYRSMFLKVKP